MLTALAKANSEAQLGKFKGPHPAPGGGRILQALRLGGVLGGPVEIGKIAHRMNSTRLHLSPSKL
jgi:hypothetical protein